MSTEEGFQSRKKNKIPILVSAETKSLTTFTLSPRSHYLASRRHFFRKADTDFNLSGLTDWALEITLRFLSFKTVNVVNYEPLVLFFFYFNTSICFNIFKRMSYFSTKKVIQKNRFGQKCYLLNATLRVYGEFNRKLYH